MPSPNYVSFTSPNAGGGFVEEERSLEQRRRLAEQLRQESAQRTPIGSTAPGGYFVATSPLTHLAQALKGVNAQRMLTQSDTDAKDLSTRRSQALSEALKGMPTARTETDWTPDDGASNPAHTTVRPTMADNAAWMGQLAQVGPQALQMGSTLLGMQQKTDEAGENRAFRSQESAATRAAQLEQRRMQIDAATQNQQLSREQALSLARERAEVQRQLAQMQIDSRLDMARFSAANRPERQPQVIQTENGPMILGPGGQAAPITGPDGQPIKAKGTEKALPAAASKALLENQQNLRRAQQAVSLITGEDITDASGQVVQQADPQATGKKGFLTYLGAAGDYALNKLDPKGVDARAAVGDLGSIIIHDRSGAAVTAAEYPRLRPFIPQATDAPKVAAQKARRFAAEYEKIQQETSDFYRESGYKVPTGALQPTSGPKPGSDRSPAPAGIEAKIWAAMTPAERALWK